MRRFLPMLIASIGILTACGATGVPAVAQPTGAAEASTAASAATAGATAEPADAATPVTLPTQPAGEAASGAADAMVALAKADLAKTLNVAADTIQLKSVESVEWNNSSLGCAKPNVAYMQVITPGYQITLTADGKTYDYRSDMRRTVVLCDNALKTK